MRRLKASLRSRMFRFGATTFHSDTPENKRKAARKLRKYKRKAAELGLDVHQYLIRLEHDANFERLRHEVGKPFALFIHDITYTLLNLGKGKAKHKKSRCIRARVLGYDHRRVRFMGPPKHILFDVDSILLIPDSLLYDTHLPPLPQPLLTHSPLEYKQARIDYIHEQGYSQTYADLWTDWTPDLYKPAQPELVVRNRIRRIPR